MRKTLLCCIFLLISLIAFLPFSFSQTITPGPLFFRYAEKDSATINKHSSFLVIAWADKIPEGCTIARKLDDHTAIVVNSAGVFDNHSPAVLAANADDRWKLSPSAEKTISEKATGDQLFIFSSFDEKRLAQALLLQSGKLKIISVDTPSHSVLVRTSAKSIITGLLHLPEVIFIDACAEPHTETSIIGYNRSFHGISAVDYTIPGANGKNMVAGVKEQKMEETDIDLYKRIVPSSIAAPSVSGHATVISSIIGGAGNSFYNGRGIANGARFFSSSFNNLFADDAAILNANKVTVQNHSYGTVIQSFYGAEAVSYDVQTWQNKNLLHVFSAGNQGTAAATTGPYANITGYGNLTGNFKMAKNIITVGAIDDKGLLPAESSSGPLFDGRVAPQLIALGPNGTSDAAAVVTGTIAVMQQVYADSNSQQFPPAALVKSILYNTANDIHRAGIDYKTGYGLLNSFEAVKAIQNKNYDGGVVSQGQQWTKNISVPAGIAQLKVTLAWTDTAAQVNTSKTIVNDLDLEVQDISSGFVYKPWVLSAAANMDSLIKLPVRKRDSLNTAEQVSIQIPAAGNYQVKVTGTSVSNGALPFFISVRQDTLNTFAFISPQHTSDVNRDENPLLDIRWKTFVADTNHTGNLYISYNGGTTWQLIKTGHKIYTNYYQWPIKDTASRALFRMETSFGNFFSTEFVISKVIRPNIDFLCADSFGLSWNKHIYASGYKLYTMIDSAYLKSILTVADSFVVLKRNLYPQLVYAVEPLLANNIPASRSIAFDITQQGVSCFYRTFYYNLLDENKLDLVLELSAAPLVDSAWFEMVSSSGGLINTIGSVKVISFSAIYHQLATDLPQGTSYWRVRIKLKSGSTVYTEIISVLTSGKKAILFYPNPVKRNQPLSWVIRQGVPSSSRLQLYDITGRLLRDYNELPFSIKTAGISPGIIVYKLFGIDGILIEAGRIVLLN